MFKHNGHEGAQRWICLRFTQRRGEHREKTLRSLRLCVMERRHPCHFEPSRGEKSSRRQWGKISPFGRNDIHVTGNSQSKIKIQSLSPRRAEDASASAVETPRALRLRSLRSLRSARDDFFSHKDAENTEKNTLCALRLGVR